MKKPKLTNLTTVNDFLNYYWLKEELILFCKTYSLPSHGAKLELMERIKIFLTSGGILKDKTPKYASKNAKDSASPLTLDTPVRHFKCDAKTADFFRKHIGNSFHFNAYLRQFSPNKLKNTENITYGELIKGWIVFEEQKKIAGKKTEISPQFEYMRFIREFFINEKDKTREDAIAAWHFIKTQPGVRDYAHYCKLKKQLKQSKS